jgi:hypothetical protein
MTALELRWALGAESEILNSSSSWVESLNEYETAFAAMRATGAEALVIVPAPELYRDTEQPHALAAGRIDYRRLEASARAPRQVC